MSDPIVFISCNFIEPIEAINDNQTKITTIIVIPGMDEHTDKTFLNSRLELSAQIRKQLMESEI